MYLGIDIGTSSVKTVLIDDRGRLAGSTTAPLSIDRPHPLWSEQNPSDWWAATNIAVAGLDLSLRSKVQAIGLTGQMHGATLLDQTLTPLRPAILWNDGRSHQECQDLTEDEPAFVSHGGNLVMPGFTAPKLAWVKRHEPDIFAQIAKVLLPKDYVRLKMTGELATDASDAAGTLWMDVGSRCWHPPLLQACGLDQDHMPPIFEGPQITGQLRRDAAEAWGMSQVPVLAGGSDNAAGALGAGAVDEGDALLSLGTSGVVFVASRSFRSNPASAVHAFCHALPERWHLMSVMLSAASCLDWACGITGLENPETLIATAEADAPVGGQEVFLPYLSGERTPHNNPHATGTLLGMTHNTTAAHIAQAVLEGVAFGMADGFDALLGADIDVNAISVIGGGSKSSHWGRILANVLKRPLVYRDGAATGPAFGAARLARYAITGDTINDAFAAPEVLNVIEPHEPEADLLAEKRARYQSMYQALKQEFKGE